MLSVGNEQVTCMPHYFFHIYYPGSALIRDDEGQELEDLPSAQQEARASLQDLAREAMRRGDPVTGLLIQIADQAGVVLASVHATEKIALAALGNATVRRLP